LGLTYTQVMFVEMLLKSRIKRGCENKTPLHTVGICRP